MSYKSSVSAKRDISILKFLKNVSFAHRDAQNVAHRRSVINVLLMQVK